MNVDFGVFLSPEVHSYDGLRVMAKKIEELDYHSIWISDHLHGMYESQGARRYEGWTLGTALTMVTNRVKLGHLTMAAPFRNPALTAKMAATLDNITGGRVILSIGAGWHRDEFKAYGFDYGSKASRSTRLEETAHILKLMWNEENPRYSGHYYGIDGAYCNPKPVQNPMPLMIAGGGEKRTLRTAAMYANMTNYAEWTGTPEEFSVKTDVLIDHCDAMGRDNDEIIKTWAAFVFIDETIVGAREKALRAYPEAEFVKEGKGLIGSPESITEKIYEYMDAGVDMFILSFLGGEWEKEITLFKEDVMPNILVK